MLLVNTSRRESRRTGQRYPCVIRRRNRQHRPIVSVFTIPKSRSIIYARRFLSPARFPARSTHRHTSPPDDLLLLADDKPPPAPPILPFAIVRTVVLNRGPLRIAPDLLSLPLFPISHRALARQIFKIKFFQQFYRESSVNNYEITFPVDLSKRWYRSDRAFRLTRLSFGRLSLNRATRVYINPCVRRTNSSRRKTRRAAAGATWEGCWTTGWRKRDE